ncbi:hypothetical protein [Haloarchaeobius iranensis]|uniref:Uncharacterized protein n=1 Tax=Haloarchaeobius iranensis TaxID=996166 RepID=A0A1H0C9S1_9EURY|nr:hypothetical protein [Haloarchaeobius iranensis]SDN54587.1 hypothetical protein SAMN05192554_1691 [Haloarchaeobius iranensis]
MGAKLGLVIPSLALAGLALATVPLVTAGGVGFTLVSGMAEAIVGREPRLSTKYSRGFRMDYPSERGGPITNHNILFDVYVAPGDRVEFNVRSSNYGDGLDSKNPGEVDPATPIGAWTIEIDAPEMDANTASPPTFGYAFSSDREGAKRETISPTITPLTEPNFTFSAIRFGNEEIEAATPMYRPIPGYVFNVPTYVGPTEHIGSGEPPTIRFTAENSLLTDFNEGSVFHWSHTFANEFDRSMLGRKMGLHEVTRVFQEPNRFGSADADALEFGVTPNRSGIHIIGLRAADPTGNSSTVVQPFEYVSSENAPSDPSVDFMVDQNGAREFTFEGLC